VDQDGVEVHFKIKQHTSLEKLMNAYCQRKGVATTTVRFLFDGARIKSGQTPKDLEMESGDVIDAAIEMVGGGDREMRLL
jgi:small ubiquitin-related modifier